MSEMCACARISRCHSGRSVELCLLEKPSATAMMAAEGSASEPVPSSYNSAVFGTSSPASSRGLAGAGLVTPAMVPGAGGAMTPTGFGEFHGGVWGNTILKHDLCLVLFTPGVMVRRASVVRH